MKFGNNKCSYCHEEKYIEIYLFPYFHGSFVMWFYVLPVFTVVLGAGISVFLISQRLAYLQ